MPTIVRTSFFKGTKSSCDPTIIDEHAIWKSYNARSDISGILRIREGSKNIFPSMGDLPIQGFEYAFEQLVFVFGKRVFKYDKETNILVLIQDIEITLTELENVTMFRWTQAGQEVVYIFGGNGIFVTDGNTVTAITPYIPNPGEDANMLQNLVGPQHGKLATLRLSLSQRVAVAGLPQSPNTVYLSAPLDITYFQISQIIQLPDDGAVITGLTNWYNTLIIFRDKDIWAFFGTDLADSAAALVQQDGSVGCVAPKSIAHVPELGICFLGPDNIYALRGVNAIENQSKAYPIGDDVGNLIRDSLRFGGLEDVPGIYHNREYRVCFPIAKADHRVFRLSLQNEAAWYIDTGPLSNNYIAIKGELYGSDPKGSLHQITKDTVFDETVFSSITYYSGMFNQMMFNEIMPGMGTQKLDGIPFSVTFKRENLQPGPSRIKKVYLYVLSLGRKEFQNLVHFGHMYNHGMFNEQMSNPAEIDTTSNQTFDLTLIVDGNEFQVEYVQVHSHKIPNTLFAQSEPIRVYEAFIRPSLKGHFAQLKVQAKVRGQLIAVLGYGIDYQPKGRIRGIRDGVTNNKNG